MSFLFRCSSLVLCSLLVACGGRVSSSDDAATTDTVTATDSNTAETVTVEDASDAETPALDSEAPDVSPGPDAEEPAPDGMTSSTAPDYSRFGPITVRALARMTAMLPNTSGCSGQQCRVELDVSLPSSGAPGRDGPWPLVVFSNGFQLDDSQYQSYALRLASWGYVVARWNTNETALSSISHDVLARMLRALIDHIAAENTRNGSLLQNQVSTTQVLLAGHSRGGKISTSAAVADPRVAGLFLIDPVDAPPPIGPAPPSAVTALQGSMRAIPLAVIGASDGGGGLMPCAPTMHNYTRFYDAARMPAFEAVVANTGHMDFLDNRATCGLTCSFCADGRTPDEQARGFAQTLFVAWAERVLRGADTSRYTQGEWIMNAQRSGLVASIRNK